MKSTIKLNKLANDIKPHIHQFMGKRILHYTAYDNIPGAAKSAYNIHKTFQAHGVNSTMIVLNKGSDDPTVISVKKGILFYFQKGLDLFRSILFKKTARRNSLNGNRRIFFKTRSLFPYQPNEVDIVFVYWINDFLNTDLQKKIFKHYDCLVVWVLMDMEPITGGCHQSMNCLGYVHSCGNCTFLDSKKGNDLSNKTWHSKKKLNEANDVFYIAPTRGLYDQVKKSSLAKDCRVEYIPLAVETKIYRPIKMASAREVLDIRESKIVICFGANNIQSIYKGVEYLEEALRILYSRLNASGKDKIATRILILLSGGNRGKSFIDTPFEVHHLGHCKDVNSMALMFQASDVFACPSIFDGGPVMIPESMMCGTPVVAFDTGGARDLIESGVNGYIAEYLNAEDLAYGIEIVVNEIGTGKMRISARNAAANLNTPENVAGKYYEFLQNLSSDSV